MKDVFVNWEGDVFKISETDSGFAAFKLVNNSWEPISGKLTATLLFEGKPIPDPSK